MHQVLGQVVTRLTYNKQQIIYVLTNCSFERLQTGLNPPRERERDTSGGYPLRGWIFSRMPLVPLSSFWDLSISEEYGSLSFSDCFKCSWITLELKLFSTRCYGPRGGLRGWRVCFRASVSRSTFLWAAVTTSGWGEEWEWGEGMGRPMIRAWEWKCFFCVQCIIELPVACLSQALHLQPKGTELSIFSETAGHRSTHTRAHTRTLSEHAISIESQSTKDPSNERRPDIKWS